MAESLPDSARSQSLGMLQAFSALGNVSAGLISLVMVGLWSRGLVGSYWRWMFSIGVAPSLLAVIVVAKLREPDAWKAAVAAGKATHKAGSLGELFSDPRWRRNALVGLLLAVAGVVGLWGIGVFSNNLTQSFIGRKFDDEQRGLDEQKDKEFVALAASSRERLELARKSVLPSQLLSARGLYEKALAIDLKKGISPADAAHAFLERGRFTPDAHRRWTEILASRGKDSLEQHIERIARRQKARGVQSLQWAAVTLMMFNIGTFFGIYAFARVTQRLGRRPTFALAFAAAALATASAFLCMSKTSDIFWMAPLMGACQLSIFGGYAIYFPELFPTRLRSTGMSFCYNFGRFVAAAGPLGTGLLTSYVFYNPAHPDPVQASRCAGAAMCCCFLVGMAALLFAPETKGQPLPE